jgi:hypothetical protein
LLKQKVVNLPIDPLRFKFDNDGIILSSFQHYCRLSKASIDNATCEGYFEDGYIVADFRPELKLILYNEEKYNPRMRFTILHEIGHVRLGHTKHGAIEEIEANFYASQVIAPNVLIKELFHRNYPITRDCLMSSFRISKECANKKMTFLNKYSETYENELDEAVLNAYKRYLFFCAPKRYNANIGINME